VKAKRPKRSGVESRKRRKLLAAVSLLAWQPGRAADAPSDAAAAEARYPDVVRGRRLTFPQDEGSHPSFRTEWWYVTGWLERAPDPARGFQITFFRTRPRTDERNPSAFTAHQILVAHAALSSAKRGKLLHDQRVARAAFELAGAREQTLNVWIDDWSFIRSGAIYQARIAARDFALSLRFTPSQPVLFQGDDGFSRKGPHEQSASYYYSMPHLRVSGEVAESHTKTQVTGSAWLDHEWSSSYMDERARGWDWIGINFDDGAALMVFRMRSKSGAPFWAGGTYRNASQGRRTFAPHEIEFTPIRAWRSPRTGTEYPVAWRIRVGALEITLEPLMDDQESDTRASVGAVYWEGAVIALREKKPVGRGYLELTGYGVAMRL